MQHRSCPTAPWLLRPLIPISIKDRRKARTVRVNDHHKSFWLWYVHHSAFSNFDKWLELVFQMLCKVFKQKLVLKKKAYRVQAWTYSVSCSYKMLLHSICIGTNIKGSKSWTRIQFCQNIDTLYFMWLWDQNNTNQ